MNFYIIDKHSNSSINKKGSYFQFFTEEICLKSFDFESLNFDKEIEIFLFIYDLDDLFTYFDFLDKGIKKIKIVVINLYLLKLLKQTKNIEYMYVYEFYNNIKKKLNSNQNY